MTMSRRHPDAFLIGVPKSGTSSLASYMAQHPQIAVSSPKESNYYCTDLNLAEHATEQEYLDCFRGSASATVRLDASILSMFSLQAAANMWQANRHARLIAILRNPIDVMQAWHSQMRFAGNEPLADFERALLSEADRKQRDQVPGTRSALRCPRFLYYRELVDYPTQMRRMLSHFNREQLLVVFFDELAHQPREVYRRVTRFLAVDAEFTPNFTVVNENKERRFRVAYKVVKRSLGPLSRRLFRPQSRHRLLRWLDAKTSVRAQRAPVSESLRSQLEAEFEPQITALSQVLEIDCSCLLARPPHIMR